MCFLQVTAGMGPDRVQPMARLSFAQSSANRDPGLGSTPIAPLKKIMICAGGETMAVHCFFDGWVYHRCVQRRLRRTAYY